MGSAALMQKKKNRRKKSLPNRFKKLETFEGCYWKYFLVVK